MNIFFEEHAAAQRAGGIEAATVGLVTALARQGIAVTRRYPDSPEADGLLPDCVHIHGIWSPSLNRSMSHWQKLGVPCVVTVHGMLEPWAFAHKRLKKRIAWYLYQKRLLNQASALHATSEREAENLRKLGLKPPIAMIPWGVEMPQEGRGQEKEMRIEETEIRGQRAESRTSNMQCRVSNVEREASQNEDEEEILGFQNFSVSTSSAKTALFVGRIFPVKGLPMLVEAWARLRPKGWKMKIVGPDEAGHRAEVEALVREAGLEADFEFTGPLDGRELAKAYQSADLFVLPSYTENFGMVVVEALANSIPVIATNGTPWKSLLDHGCGWWSEISSSGIKVALAAATSLDAKELALMGNKGRQWVQRDFSWGQVAQSMESLYRSILTLK